MIDLAALATLFFEASKEWSTPKVARFDPLEDAEKEEVFRNLKEKGHTLQWVDASWMRQWATTHVTMKSATTLRGYGASGKRSAARWRLSAG